MWIILIRSKRNKISIKMHMMLSIRKRHLKKSPKNTLFRKAKKKHPWTAPKRPSIALNTGSFKVKRMFWGMRRP